MGTFIVSAVLLGLFALAISKILRGRGCCSCGSCSARCIKRVKADEILAKR